MEDKFSNPWKTLDTRTVYDNPWIRVREDRVIRPDGNVGIYGVVHYKNIAIGILPIDEDGFTYLVGQFRYTLDQYSWEIPEGGCPEGEEPLDAAKRELLEETGLIADNWQVMGKMHTSNSVTDEWGIYYLATGLTEYEARPEGTERLERMRVPFAEALRMVMEGEITDSLSVIAILKYAVLKKGS